jgi:hypothetical protein
MMCAVVVRDTGHLTTGADGRDTGHVVVRVVKLDAKTSR